ncbi:MAG: cupredoxin domain-containing protein [Candidatus Omnitrophota bacterium]|nr:cupredoxin domain-containing protein [Candidatus Omnitrophota bacterium]
MRKYPILFIILLFSVMFINSHCLAVNPIEGEQKSHQHQGQEGKNHELSGKVENGVRVIQVKASRYKFEPDPILVKLGEKVRLVVTSIDAAHGIAISEFKINLAVSAGKTERIEFIADKQGEFQAYCSVYCGAGHGQMHASFIVK